MAVAECPGVIVTDAQGVPACEDMSGAPLAWIERPAFEIGDVDPAVAGQAFAAGFVLVASVWAIGWTVRALLGMIRR